nr:TaqI-like C-terminal specificity domain-containing protein [Hymenobacter siberiensis]
MGNPPYIRQEAFKELKPHLKQRFGHVFAGTADLYVYFLQLGAELLAPGGELSYIVPNKWLRAGYGAALRGWLASSQTLLEFVDFGDLPVFPEATTYPAIVALRQDAPAAESTFRAAEILKLLPDFAASVISVARAIPQSSLKADGWNLADADSQDLLDKLRAAGNPLGEYANGTIYYGIKTGYNEAFVVSASTRNALIKADPNSADIIKPFLAGRDVKRYQQSKTEKYLLFMRRGIDPEKYPAVMAHLEQFRKQLEPRPKHLSDKAAAEWPGRKPGTYKWYEVQDSIEYWQEFEKPKICFPDIAPILSFTLDVSGACLANTGYFLPIDDLFLLGVLNSSLIDVYFRSLSASIRGGYLRFFKQYVEQLPIPAATPAEQAAIAALVQQILDAKAADPTADTTAPEAAVDAAVAALYGVALPAAGGAL